MVTDSLTIYQRRYRSYIQLPLVLELLLLDEAHPRSIAFQLHQLSVHISALPKSKKKSQITAEERAILKAYTDLKLSNVLELTQVNEDDGVYQQFEELLANTTDLLWRLSELIAEAYFSHSQTSQLMVHSTPEDEL